MTFERWLHRASAIATLCLLFGTIDVLAQTKSSASAKSPAFVFGGTQYVHRWSKDGQNEFTPPNDSDLKRWQDMVTINVRDNVKNGDQLADVANRVLANYQSHGKIVRTDSKPRTQQQQAEHLVVALLGNPDFIEAAFARFALKDGVGVVTVYSHRVYGKDAGQPMGQWLQTNGPTIEKTLMTWDKMPSVTTLKQLPQSQ